MKPKPNNPKNENSVSVAAKLTNAEYNLINILNELNKSKTLEKTLKCFCRTFSETFSDSVTVYSKIIFLNTEYSSKKFTAPLYSIKRNFQTPDRVKGRIEIFFNKDKKSEDFVQTINESLDFLTPIVVGVLSKFRLEKLRSYNIERKKELESINKTTEILKSGNSLEQSFLDICTHLPDAMQFPRFAASRIFYAGKSYVSRPFNETPWVLKQTFDTPENKKGSIEIFYLKEFPIADEGPFLDEERSLINNLSALIAGTVSKKALQNILIHNTERLKELKGINTTSEILKNKNTIEEALREICTILPASWKFVNDTVIRIQ